MFDFLFAWLAYPWPVWIGTALGFAAAYAAWVLMPETVDRASLGAWLVIIGFVGGIAWSIATIKEHTGRDEKE